jgi:hypothetical protein
MLNPEWIGKCEIVVIDKVNDSIKKGCKL